MGICLLQLHCRTNAPHDNSCMITLGYLVSLFVQLVDGFLNDMEELSDVFLELNDYCHICNIPIF